MISFVNGPLPAVLPVDGANVILTDPRIRFCSVDADIPLSAVGLASVPVLHKIEQLRGDIILVFLECHRAPDDLYAALLSKPFPVVCQGDSECLRPRLCSVFASELAKLPSVPPPVVHLHWVHTITEALEQAQGGGRIRILVSNRDNVRTVMSHLRPNGDLLAGDPVYDKRSRQFACVSHLVPGKSAPSFVVRLDTGRRTTYGQLWPRLVESPCSWGSGECDTLIILPDVCELVGTAAARRVRYQLISVGVAPTIYGFVQSTT